MLIGNRSVLLKSPGRFLSGTVASSERSNFTKPGMMRGANYSALSGIPSGHLSPSAWLLPRRSGAMASRNDAGILIDISGQSVGGITSNGLADILISVANATIFPINDTPQVRTAASFIQVSVIDAAGQLISSGVGASSFSIQTNTPLLTASIEGIGASSFVITTNNAQLGALADGIGQSFIAINVGNATAFPLNDASPLRNATAAMNVTGALTPYAIGSMEGSTADLTVVTNDSVAQAVWAKIIEAGYSAEQIIRILAAQAAGNATGLEGADPRFTGLDGVTVRIDGSYSAGVRTIDNLNGDV